MVAKDLEEAAARGADPAELSIALRMALSFMRVWNVDRSNGVAMINPATYILIITIGASLPQQHGEFPSYHHCYEAAQTEIKNLGRDVRWDCVLKQVH